MAIVAKPKQVSVPASYTYNKTSLLRHTYTLAYTFSGAPFIYASFLAVQRTSSRYYLFSVHMQKLMSFVKFCEIHARFSALSLSH